VISTENNLFDELLNSVRTINAKDLRKKLDSISSITSSDMNRLTSVLKKRHDWDLRDGLRGGYAWPEALKKLEERVIEN
jgi:hypothetical protein